MVLTEVVPGAVSYRETGFTVIPHAMDRSDATGLALRALEIHREQAIFKEGESSRGGHSLYYVFDGFAVDSVFPELAAWYAAIRSSVEQIVGTDVICSPYPRSAVNVKVYDGDDSGQGWHHDSNPVSALLYLGGSGEPTELVGLDGACYRVSPFPGKLLIFQGRQLLHRVPPGSSNRVVAPLNFYHPWDMGRPVWVDAAIYENAAPPAL